jgi:putative colanic acid biosynthesis UDP-glucose lipid carrier transferase
MRQATPVSALWGSGGSTPAIIELFGIPCANQTLAGAATDLATAAAAGRPLRVLFLNAHVVNCCNRDQAYRRTVASADRIYADGSGMAIAARLVGQRFVDNVNGTDLFPQLCKEAVARGTTIFLLGGKPGIADAAAATISAHGLGAAIAGTHHGYFAHGSAEEEAVIRTVNASGAGILLVGMGVPQQDQWIERNRHRLTPAVLIGVGGLFDYFSGRIPRAPHALRSVGLEWAWRLAQEPGRMWRRYLIGNVTFLAAAIAAARARRNADRDGTSEPRRAGDQDQTIIKAVVPPERLSRRVAIDMVRILEATAIGGAFVANGVMAGGELFAGGANPIALSGLAALAAWTATALLKRGGLYDPRTLSPLPISIPATVAAVGVSGLIVLVMLAAFGFFDVDALRWLALSVVTSAASALAMRGLARVVLEHFARSGRFATPIAIIGVSEAANQLAEFLRDRPHGMTLAGIFDDRPVERTGAFEHANRSGTTADLVALCRTGAVDRVIIAMPPTAQKRIAELTVDLERLPLTLDVCTHLSADVVASVSPRGLERLGPVGLVSIKKTPLADWGCVLKSALDYAIALALLPVLLPVFGLVAVAIKLDSKGPVFFRQTRKGYNQRPFKIWKFRTMTVLEDGARIRQATKGDARVTRVGAVLRRTSLDELPQIINVLRGEMSIVGPRPHALAHDNQWEEEHFRYVGRQQVKPGITGWAQVHGFRGELDAPEKLKMRIDYDVEYVRTWSIWLDLKILALTPLRGFVNKNAY